LIWHHFLALPQLQLFELILSRSMNNSLEMGISPPRYHLCAFSFRPLCDRRVLWLKVATAWAGNDVPCPISLEAESILTNEGVADEAEFRTDYVMGETFKKKFERPLV
jgi:hypothetical protein